MRDDLLEKARKQAKQSDSSVRAAALLWIARADSTVDASRARQTLLEGVQGVQTLPSPLREHLFREARRVAAAVSPELLADIPRPEHEGPPFGFADDVAVIQTMLTHNHVEAAFDYVMCQQDPITFPFFSVGAVLHRRDQRHTEDPAGRMALLRHAVEVWRKSLSDCHLHVQRHFRNHHHDFVGFFGHFWKDFPPEEALSLARTIIERAFEEPDAGTSAGYGNEIHFSSPRQNTLFQILHVLRHLDPPLAQSLIDSHNQLAAAVHRYPNGLETMSEEAEAEAERHRAALIGQESTGECWGYILTGDPKDFDRERHIIDAARKGDFAPSIEDALEKYREDTLIDAPNYAPKEYWPSTGALRRVLYDAGKRLGDEAFKLLELIPDDNIRLFASIELAAALAGVPASQITSMKQRRPPSSQATEAKIIAASCTTGIHRTEPRGPAMHSTDGRLIRCPKCQFQPSTDIRWICKCSHMWNTFQTAGKCPACHFQWEVTACPHCGEMSQHGTWYVSEP
jgi:hypothetical protein